MWSFLLKVSAGFSLPFPTDNWELGKFLTGIFVRYDKDKAGWSRDRGLDSMKGYRASLGSYVVTRQDACSSVPGPGLAVRLTGRSWLLASSPLSLLTGYKNCSDTILMGVDFLLLLMTVRCEVCPPRVPDQYWHRESSAAPHVTLSHREQTFHHVTYHRSPSQCCALEITPHISHQSNTVDATSTKFLVASWIFCFAEFKQKSVMTIKQQM